MRVDQLLANFDLDLRLVHFPLHPGLGQEGIPLAELFARKGMRFDLDAAQARLAAVARSVGLPFQPNRMAWDTRLAQELSAWAEEQGNTRLHKRLFQAVFVDGRNVGNPQELRLMAEEVGLDGEEAARVLRDRTHKARVDRDWQYARQLGVTGVPTAVIGRQGVVGAQPYEVLERLATQAGAQRRLPT